MWDYKPRRAAQRISTEGSPRPLRSSHDIQGLSYTIFRQLAHWLLPRTSTAGPCHSVQDPVSVSPASTLARAMEGHGVETSPLTIGNAVGNDGDEFTIDGGFNGMGQAARAQFLASSKLSNNITPSTQRRAPSFASTTKVYRSENAGCTNPVHLWSTKQ